MLLLQLFLLEKGNIPHLLGAEVREGTETCGCPRVEKHNYHCILAYFFANLQNVR